MNRKKKSSDESFTDGCALIFSICNKLTTFDISRFTASEQAQLLLHNRPPTTCSSSQLRSLFVNVATFDDCLCLLDGRLTQLSSLTVNIESIDRSSTVTNDMVGRLKPNFRSWQLFHVFRNLYPV